jgi:hypothetical protein
MTTRNGFHICQVCSKYATWKIGAGSDHVDQAYACSNHLLMVCNELLYKDNRRTTLLVKEIKIEGAL